MGFTVNTSDFNRATRALEDTARKNTATYGRAIARQFEQTAKTGAPWTDRRGSARGKLYGASEASGSRVHVQMGGLAPNYKQGMLSASDYMEYLEFDHGGKYAVIGPTAEAIAADVMENFGEAALKGNVRFNIRRNGKELNKRRKQVMQIAWLGAQFLTSEQKRYQQWLSDRSVFNR